MLNIRPATRADAPVIASLVRELADYEKLLDEAKATPQDFLRELESPNPVIHVLIAEWDGVPAGFALYFFNFSTFVGRPGLYLEDLFVRPAQRSHGIGRALLRALARVAQHETDHLDGILFTDRIEDPSTFRQVEDDEDSAA